MDKRSSTVYWYKRIPSTDQPEVAGRTQTYGSRILIPTGSALSAVQYAQRTGKRVSGDGTWNWNSSHLIRSESVRLEELEGKKRDCCLQLSCEVNGMGCGLGSASASGGVSSGMII